MTLNKSFHSEVSFPYLENKGFVLDKIFKVSSSSIVYDYQSYVQREILEHC